MSTNELTSKIQEMQELKRLREDLDAEITAAEDAIKKFMDAESKEEMTAGAFKITYKPVTSTRLDSKAVKAELPELFARYSVTTTTRRFQVR